VRIIARFVLIPRTDGTYYTLLYEAKPPSYFCAGYFVGTEGGRG